MQNCNYLCLNSVTIAASGFIQVFLVAMNTVFLSRAFAWGALGAGFTISYIWSHNVKRVAFGNEADRIAYSIGAGLGSVAGMYAGKFVMTFF